MRTSSLAFLTNKSVVSKTWNITTVGNTTIQIPRSFKVFVCLIGGGGRGASIGNRTGGGGGALAYSTTVPVSFTSLTQTITVGSGGTSNTVSNGSATTAFGISAGGGSGYSGATNNAPGGSATTTSPNISWTGSLINGDNGSTTTSRTVGKTFQFFRFNLNNVCSGGPILSGSSYAGDNTGGGGGAASQTGTDSEGGAIWGNPANGASGRAIIIARSR